MGELAALDNALKSIDNINLARVAGRLVRVNGILLESVGCRLAIGQRCRVESAEDLFIEAQVVGFDREVTYLMPFKQPDGLMSGARVFPCELDGELLIGDSWLGRVVNGLGEPIDGKGSLGGETPLQQQLPQIHPLQRQPVSTPLDVGVKAINGLLTIGKGQRVGLMAGSGVGKSMLLGMMTRYTQADVVVVGLIGERGREVKEFIDHSLQASGMAKSVVIAAPADESPLMRIKATELCHSVATYYRDKGKDVLLLVDSLTRYAMAQREIALSLGEPPATKGYPPSAFSIIPRLAESAGNSYGSGTMTAIYTVLAEGDDQQDPIVDCARAVLDGHIVLSRQLQSIDGSIALIGVKVAAALIGTFLGVFICYCLMDPMANAMEQEMKKKLAFFECVRMVLVNHVAGKPSLLAVDAGRKMLPLDSKPTFATLDSWINQLTMAGA
ncbi:FliI/YscN family ATPase [Yersinia enterocolitica]